MKQWAKKSVLVLGLGETGLSLVRWLSAQGASVRVADSRNNPPSLDVLKKEFPKVDIHCGFFRSELLEGIELIAISPGVPLRDPFVARAAAKGIPVVGDVELFALALPQKKSTTVDARSSETNASVARKPNNPPREPVETVATPITTTAAASRSLISRPVFLPNNNARASPPVICMNVAKWC